MESAATEACYTKHELMWPLVGYTLAWVAAFVLYAWWLRRTRQQAEVVDPYGAEGEGVDLDIIGVDGVVQVTQAVKKQSLGCLSRCWRRLTCRRGGKAKES